MARQDNPGVNTFPLFYNSFSTSPFQNDVINWTRTISPKMVNEARVGVNNVMLNSGGADKGLGNIAQNAGIATAGAGLLTCRASPMSAAWAARTSARRSLFANTTFHYADNLTLIRGRHMMKMGGQALREWIDVFYSGNDGRTGYISFNGRFTAQNAINPVRNATRRGRFHAGTARRLWGAACNREHLGPTCNDLGLLFPGRLAALTTA